MSDGVVGRVWVQDLSGCEHKCIVKGCEEEVHVLLLNRLLTYVGDSLQQECSSRVVRLPFCPQRREGSAKGPAHTLLHWSCLP